MVLPVVESRCHVRFKSSPTYSVKLCCLLAGGLYLAENKFPVKACKLDSATQGTKNIIANRLMAVIGI